MLQLMNKISGYKSKIRRYIRGDEYDFEDFCVRVGVSFDKQNSPSGVTVQIEYRPCAYVSQCKHIILELMDKIVASLVPPPTPSHDPDSETVAGAKYKFKTVPFDSTHGDLSPFTYHMLAALYSSLLTSPTPAGTTNAVAANNTGTTPVRGAVTAGK